MDPWMDPCMDPWMDPCMDPWMDRGWIEDGSVGWLGEQRPTPPPPREKNLTGMAPEKKTTPGFGGVGLPDMYQEATRR